MSYTDDVKRLRYIQNAIRRIKSIQSDVIKEYPKEDFDNLKYYLKHDYRPQYRSYARKLSNHNGIVPMPLVGGEMVRMLSMVDSEGEWRDLVQELTSWEIFWKRSEKMISELQSKEKKIKSSMTVSPKDGMLKVTGTPKRTRCQVSIRLPDMKWATTRHLHLKGGRWLGRGLYTEDFIEYRGIDV